MSFTKAVDDLVTPPSSAPVDGGYSGEPEPEPEPAATGSVLAAVRERARQLRTEQTVTLDIPGYDGYLAARFHAVSLGRVFGKRLDGTTPINPEAGMIADVLAGACDDVLIRDSPDSGVTHPVFKDQAARFDDDLVEALDLQPEQRTARAVIVALCGGGALGESRVWALYMQYQGWLLAGVTGSEAPVESEAARQAVGEYLPD